MSIEVQVSNRQRKIKIDRAWLNQLLAKLAEALGQNLIEQPVKQLPTRAAKQFSNRGVFSLSIVSNKQIKELNKLWRGKDSATDVLSFPLCEIFELKAPPGELPWELGEIVISAERALEQAEEFGHSFEREFAFLFIHGCLHILGFDHETAADEKVMFARQKEILDQAGYPRTKQKVSRIKHN